MARSTSSVEEKRVVRGVSQRRLAVRRLLRHRVGMLGLALLLVLYTVAIFAPFFAPYGRGARHPQHLNAPPQMIRFVDVEGKFHWRPFVYEMRSTVDRATFSRVYELDTEQRNPLRFFVRGTPYRLLFFESDLRLFGVEDGHVFLFGTDRLGRDVLSRVVFGARVSLFVGLLGVALMVTLGTLVGIVSGYYGGVIDAVIQRFTEIILSFPAIPLWMGLAAAVPSDWSTITIFFVVTIIVALIRWVHLARQLRGIVLSLRSSEYVIAAKAVGASDIRIILRHILPNTMSHVLVISTLAIPQMILAESALSFLGLGIQPPEVSWGALLKDGQNIRALVQTPWLLVPGVFIVITVLAYNFVGDAVRDALDPRHR